MGAMLVGNLSAPPATRSIARLEAASPPPIRMANRLADVAGEPITMAGVRCRGSYRGAPTQVIMVKASGTRATLIGCTRRGNEYRRTLGPFPARVGFNGVAPAGTKREGDGRTPSGTFAMGSGFGTAGSPGLRQGWLRVGSRDVWVDDPRSALYNTHQRMPARGRWRSAERLSIPAYRYAQVIRYNTDRIPGRGSAIFMHVGTARTAGCIALSTSNLLTVMRWERSGAVMVIS
jgi:L,D-peptidoglycan transpeptidase YkuD (ErfK/YbiS/YcfS/YnhG family)